MARFRPHKMYAGALLAQEVCSYQAMTQLLMRMEGRLAVLIHSDPIDIAHYNFFAIGRAFRYQLAVRTAQEALTPELDSGTAGRRFVANSISNRDIAAVGNGVAALNRFPRRVLRFAELSFFRWMPADCGRVENNLCSLQSG